jgi:hypothetical protein
VLELGTLTSFAVCCVLASAPASDASDASDASEESEPVAVAQQLFHVGQAKYETHDYLGAIEAFTAAYALTEEMVDPERRDLALARLRYNLARAHVYAYDIDAKPEHLGLARRLIADYRANERAVGSDPDTDTDVQQLEDDLAKRERAHEQADGQPDELAGSNPERARAKKRAGITLLALAGPFAGLAVAGGLMGAQANGAFTSVTTEAARTAALQRGQIGNVLLGVGAGLAIVSAATGATLLGLSLRTGGRTNQTELSLNASPTGLVFAGKF